MTAVETVWNENKKYYFCGKLMPFKLFNSCLLIFRRLEKYCHESPGLKLESSDYPYRWMPYRLLTDDSIFEVSECI